MASRSEQINSILEQLVSNNGNDINGAALISSDGILISSRMSTDVNADRMGAIAATMMGVTTRVVNDLKIGKANEAIVNAESGYLLVMPVATQMILAIILRQHANLGMIRIEARETGRAIAELMNA